MPNAKRCSRCRDERPLREFHRDTRVPGGLRSACKRCRRIEPIDRQVRLREALSEAGVRWVKAHTGRHWRKYDAPVRDGRTDWLAILVED